MARVEEVQHPYWKRLLKETMEKVRWEWKGKEVLLHPAHGDFVPWNASWADGRLYLYDWEYAQEEVPAGYDLFHFLIQSSRLVENGDPYRTLKYTFYWSKHSYVQDYWMKVGVDGKEIALLLQLYVFDRLIFSSISEPRCAAAIWFYNSLFALSRTYLNGEAL